MFRDRVHLKLKAGNGGSGKISFGLNHVPLGGTGGNGGDVYLEGDNNLYDFHSINSDHTYAAEDGEHGGVKNLTGKNGKDLILKVPLITKAYDEKKNLMVTITAHGQRELILSGGIGGLGNEHFRRYGRNAAREFQPGKPGKKVDVTLELELQSDIIFIGLPNAGKSSILNTLTNADAKVAAYAFTTLSPHLGRMDDVVLMDLPGLIENTAEGKGLGTHFVKHTKAAHAIAHFVSLESGDPVADYELIRKELEAISPELVTKPEIIILTKTDLIPAADVAKKAKLFKKYKKTIVTVSAYDLDAIANLRKALGQLAQTHP
jgi:GTP-binding protein